MKTKLVLFFLVFGLVMGLGIVPNATATGIPISSYWDLGYPAGTAPGPVYPAGPGDWGVGDGDSLTQVFDKIQYSANTTTYQYDDDTDGKVSKDDTFVDSGNATATALLPIPGSGKDEEGLGFADGYEFTFAWTNLTGYIQEVNPGTTEDAVTNKYTGGTINFYVDDSMNADFHSTTDGPWCAEDDTGFTDGTLVATVSDISGTGHSNFLHGTNTFTGGDYNLTGKFTYLINDFWFEDTGEDLLEKYVSLEWLLGYTAGDTDKKNYSQTFGSGADPWLFKICSEHDSSFQLEVIPEPATMLLLGSGLIGLAGFGRKKKFFKKG